jgi:tetratricopeptide (TPR) repeat protein
MRLRIESLMTLVAAGALALTGGVPRKAAQLNQDANKAYVKKDYDTADRLYDEALTKSPDTPELSYNRGNALYRQGKLGDAAANLRRATDSTDPVLRQKGLYNLGNALHDLGELEMAAKSYREALKLNPADRDAKINYEKTLREMKEHPQQQKQQQDQNQQQDKNQQNQKPGGKGQKGEDSPDQNGDQEQAKNQPDSQQKDQKPQQGEEQKEQPGEGQDDKQQPMPDDAQMAGMDSIPVDGLTREEALRILEAMRDQEKELQKKKARQVKARSRRVDKDW